ncbi:MAG: calcium-binding protein [Cyanobacteria bacterium P01_D01_bin.156]
MEILNNFEDGSTQGWGIGNPAVHPNPPANVASGGPDGADDNFLQTQSTGGGGAGSRLAFFNEGAAWTGDYAGDGVTGVTATANNQGSSDIVLRVALDGAGGRFVTTEGITLAPGSGWQDVAFSIEAADLTAVGGTDVNATLGDVSQIRFINSSTPSYQGAAVPAQLGIDNIATVIEEPPVDPPTDPPSGLPVVSFEAVPATISEEGTVEERLLRLEFAVDGEIPEGGLVVLFENLFGITDQADSEAEGAAFEGLGLAPPFDQENNIIGVRLLENQAAIQLPMINDLVEETTTFDFRLLEGDGYTLDPEQNATLFTITDDNGGPGVGPTIGLSVSETSLAEGDTFTVSFAVDGTIPAGGVDVLVTSDESVAGPLGQFELSDLSTLQLSGVSNLRPGDDRGQSFIATITEADASITLAVFDDILAEGPVEIPFTLANGELYEVDPAAESITLTISDQPQPAGPTVGLSVDQTNLVEGGDSVTLTISVDGEIPVGGLPVLINDTASAGSGIRSLTEFNVGNVTTTGIEGFPSPAEGDSGFFVTVTEPTATITLAALDDGADEDEAEELFTFEVIDGEAYEVDPAAGSITINITDAADVGVGTAPVVSISTDTPVLTEDEQPVGRFTLTVEGEIPDDGQGVVVTIGGEGVEKLFAPRFLDGSVPIAFEPADGVVPIGFTGTEVTLGLLVPEVTSISTIFNDIVEELPDVLNFEILPSDAYTVGQGTVSVTVEDGASANPGGGPTVSLSVSDTDLIEGEEFTVNIAVDETTGVIPEGGLELFIDGGPTDLGEFNIFGENGIDPDTDLVGLAGFPEQGDDLGGFFVTVEEPQASITLSVFEDGPGEGEEVLNFVLVDGEQYEVNPDAGMVDLTINDTPEGTPIISITADTTEVSEEDGTTQTVTFSVTNGEIPTPVFDDDGNLVSGGLPFLVDGSALATLGEELVGGNPTIGEGIAFGSFFDPERPLLFNFVLLENNATATSTFLNDIIEEAPEEYTFTLLPSDAGPIDSDYVVSADAATVSLTLTDGNGGPGVGPTVAITTTETDLVEGGTVTLDFTVDGEIPADGLEVLVQSPTPGAIGEFAIFDADGNFLIETTGMADFPISADGVGSSFLATITEPNASITLSVFDDGPGEGLETLTFEVVNGEEYEVSETNGSVTVNIDDAPPLPVVSLTTTTTPFVTEDGQPPTFDLVFTVDGDIPDDGQGVVITLGGDLLELFGNQDLLDPSAGIIFDPIDGAVPIANRGAEVDFGLTAETVTVTVALFDDILEEESLTLDFEVLEGDGYNVGQAVTSITIEDGDIPDQSTVPTVSLSVSDTELVEGEELTVFFDVDETNGAIPAEGLQVFVSSGPTDIGEFNIFGENGIDPVTDLVGLAGFPEQGDDRGGFFATIVEPQASITLSVFDDGANEGLETLTFGLANGEQYEVGDGTVTLTINDFEIVGTDESETIVGDDADNTIDGEAGDDTIAGGLGSDIILGDDGDDVLRGDLNARSPQDDVAGGNDIIFGGAGNDRIGGKAGNDILSGDEGDDIIYGDAGDDILMGVTGNDILIGDNFSDGSGSDLFVFGSGDGTDTVLDFEVGIDRIGIVEGEFTFADVTLTQDGANTVLGVSTTGETLAVLNNVQATALGESDFITVPDVSNIDEALALI